MNFSGTSNSSFRFRWPTAGCLLVRATVPSPSTSTSTSPVRACSVAGFRCTAASMCVLPLRRDHIELTYHLQSRYFTFLRGTDDQLTTFYQLIYTIYLFVYLCMQTRFKPAHIKIMRFVNDYYTGWAKNKTFQHQFLMIVKRHELETLTSYRESFDKLFNIPVITTCSKTSNSQRHLKKARFARCFCECARSGHLHVAGTSGHARES